MLKTARTVTFMGSYNDIFSPKFQVKFESQLKFHKLTVKQDLFELEHGEGKNIINVFKMNLGHTAFTLSI